MGPPFVTPTEGARFWAPTSEIPQVHVLRSQMRPAKALFSSSRSSDGLAHILPFSVTSINVFRAAILSIVLTLAAGPNTALLCNAWCHPGEHMGNGCEYKRQSASPMVTSNEDCKEAIVGAMAFVREEGQRISAPDVQSAAVVPRFAFTPSVPQTRSGYEPGGRRLLEARPLVLALQI
jgi:hypothetical protein